MNGPAAVLLVDEKDIAQRKSWKVGVFVKSAPHMAAFNALRFGVKEDAIYYASELKVRWRDVVNTSVVESDDPANCSYPVPSDRYATVQRER